MKNKLEGNVKRDKKNYAQLESMGIKVMVVWGCEIKQMMKDEAFLEEYFCNIVYEIINHIYGGKLLEIDNKIETYADINFKLLLCCIIFIIYS